MAEKEIKKGMCVIPEGTKNMNDSIEKPSWLRERRLQIMELEKMKATLTDAAEINAINQQIDALEVYDRLEERNNMKALIDAVFNDSYDDDELDEDQKLFYKLADQGAVIPAYKAMRLLGKLVFDKIKESVGQSTVAWHAGNAWLREYVNNDKLKRFEKTTFFDMMRFLCPEYDNECWETLDMIAIDDEATDKYTYQLMREVDLETAQALCHGVWLGYL